jgi:hypothetical protein
MTAYPDDFRQVICIIIAKTVSDILLPGTVVALSTKE